MEYELINPSDKYTFIAKNKEVAALVVLSLSKGYGAVTENNDENQNIPVLLFDNEDEWFKNEFGKDIEESLNENKVNLSEALDSFMLGGFEDRKRYKLALESIDDDEKREAFKAKWQDARTSMNDIGGYAHKLAKAVLDY